MFYSVETKRLLIWKCQRHYLIITRIITSKWDNFSKSDKNLSTFVSTLANFWKFFVRNTSSALYHFSYFSRIDYFNAIIKTFISFSITFLILSIGFWVKSYLNCHMIHNQTWFFFVSIITLDWLHLNPFQMWKLTQ